MSLSNGIKAVGLEVGMSWKNRFDRGMEEMRQNHAELLKMMEESLKKMDRILEMVGLLTESEKDEAKTPNEENPVNKKKNQSSNMEQEEVNQDSVSPPSMAFPSVLPPRNHSPKQGEVCIICQKGRCYRVSCRAPLPPLSQPPASPPLPSTSPPLPQQPSARPPLVLNQGESTKKLEKQNQLPPEETNADEEIPVLVIASIEREMTTNQRSKPPPPPPPLSLPETEENNGGGMNSNSNQVGTQTEVQRRLKGLTAPSNSVSGEIHLGQLEIGPNTKTWAKIGTLGSLQTDRPMDSVKDGHRGTVSPNIQQVNKTKEDIIKYFRLYCSQLKQDLHRIKSKEMGEEEDSNEDSMSIENNQYQCLAGESQSEEEAIPFEDMLDMVEESVIGKNLSKDKTSTSQ
ncbi:hypothetical protein LXL04_028611 [Taraxacum kok-saghyz]